MVRRVRCTTAQLAKIKMGRWRGRCAAQSDPAFGKVQYHEYLYGLTAARPGILRYLLISLLFGAPYKHHFARSFYLRG